MLLLDLILSNVFKTNVDLLYLGMRTFCIFASMQKINK